MSIDHSLSQILDEDTSHDAKHKVTRYRRRDLRNDLASRMNIGGEFRGNRQRREPNSPSKKRVKLENIPLDVSDYTLEDMVQEFGKPVYSNFYDTKESRTAVFEFDDSSVLQKIVDKYNDTELNGGKLKVEINDSNGSQDRRRRRGDNRGSGGSHYAVGKKKGKAKEQVKPTTVQDLNAELEEYMNS